MLQIEKIGLTALFQQADFFVFLKIFLITPENQILIDSLSKSQKNLKKKMLTLGVQLDITPYKQADLKQFEITKIFCGTPSQKQNGKCFLILQIYYLVVKITYLL